MWWRNTTAPYWSNSRLVTNATSLLLKDVNIDDWFFGVSSVSTDGYESPVEFPGPTGAFNPARPMRQGKNQAAKETRAHTKCAAFDN